MSTSQNEQFDADAFLRKEKERISKIVRKRLKTALRHLEEYRQQLNRCREWQTVYHQAELLQANLYKIKSGLKEIAVDDWEQEGIILTISLDQHLKPYEQVTKLFRQSKKLRLGQPHLEKQLEKVEEEAAFWSMQPGVLEQLVSWEDLREFCHKNRLLESHQKRSEVAQKTKSIKPYRVYTTDENLQIWVGRSAKDNERLTFNHARGGDWWFHARDYSGSHVVLRAIKGKEPDQNSILDAAELALRFSKGESKKEGEVCLTQVKWLNRIKSAPGKVMFSKCKVLKVKLDEDRWQRLKKGKG